MNREKPNLLDFFAEAARENRPLPSIPEIGKQLGVSTSILREQLEVARQLGIVEIRPKTGISLRPFSFTPLMTLGLNYAEKIDQTTFDYLSSLRKQLELAYWAEAAPLLSRQDILELEALVVQANEKIQPPAIQIPKEEHRSFHLGIFKHLENPLVISLFESYWALYQKSDLLANMDRTYLEAVWVYHLKIVEALKARDYEKGYELLQYHMELVKEVKKPAIKQRFE